MSTEDDDSAWTEEDESIESFYAAVGCALVGCQTAEKLIAFSLTRLFPEEPIETVEMFERIDKQNRRRMLGQLIGELQKRVGLAEDFEGLLLNFLEHRKALVHDFERITAHNPFTPEGRAEIEEYARITAVKAEKIVKIFHALIDAATEQLGIHEKLRSRKPEIYDSDFLVELRKILGPHLHKLVFKKPKADRHENEGK